jgi:hypothetical protein
MIELTAGTTDGKLKATRTRGLGHRQEPRVPRATYCGVDVGAAAVIGAVSPIQEKMHAISPRA